MLSQKLKICDLPEYKRVPPKVEIQDETTYYISLSFGKSYRNINPDTETLTILEEFFFKKAKDM
jgi:hypothetical protein